MLVNILALCYNESMEQIITNNFIINYDECLSDFVYSSLEIFDSKQKILNELFDKTDKNDIKLTAHIFSNRADFVKYIQSIADGHTPPDFATGCFYNGGIQLYVDPNNKYQLESSKYTLLHESVHLDINSFIYNKYHIDRIDWFDESYANFLDGRKEANSIEELKRILPKLKKIENNFNLNKIKMCRQETVITDEYNAYDIFYIIGKYIFENNLAKKYLEVLSKNPKDIQDLGNVILSKAINYGEKCLQGNTEDKIKDDETKNYTI